MAYVRYAIERLPLQPAHPSKAGLGHSGYSRPFQGSLGILQKAAWRDRKNKVSGITSRSKTGTKLYPGIKMTSDSSIQISMVKNLAT